MTVADLLLKTMAGNGHLPVGPQKPCEPLRVDPAPVAPVNGYLALQKTGRRSDGHNGDHGRVVHGVPSSGVAYCGTSPQGAGDWSAHESEAVTCERCLRKISSLHQEVK